MAIKTENPDAEDRKSSNLVSDNFLWVKWFVGSFFRGVGADINVPHQMRTSHSLFFSQEDERKRAMMMGQFSFMGESDKEVLDDSSILVECVQEWKSANRDERKRVRIQYEAAESSTGEDPPPLRRTKGIWASGK